MNKILDNIASGGATAAIGTGLGLITQKIADKRQLKQQEKLNELQIKGNKELAKYGNELQYEMWQKTNYPAQVEMLKEAGLNPGLMYGGAGAGGQTGASTGGQVTGGNAPAGGGCIS